MAGRKLVVEFIGDTDSLNKAFRSSEQQTNKFGGSLKRAGKIAAFTAGGAAFGGLVVTLKRGIDEFNDSQKVMAQTTAVLKSTGGAAGVSAKHVSKLATQLSVMSGVDDEVIQAQENMLLSFKGVRNEAGKGNKIFDRATKVILDYSARTGKDGTQAAQLFGKALNEISQGQIPTSIRGLGKLSKATQNEIKEHVKAGDAAGAQAVLLKQLEARYGGAAKASGSTFSGSLHKLGNAFDEVAGSIVSGAAPAIQKYADKLSVWLSKSKNQQRIQDAVKKGVDGIKTAFQTLKGIFDKVWPVLSNIVDKMGGWKTVLGGIVALKLASKISGFAGALGNFNPKMNTAATNTGKFGQKLGRLQNIGAITIPIAIAGSMKGDSFVTKVLKAMGVGATAALILGGPAGIGVGLGTLAFSIFAGTKDQSTNSPESGSLNAGGAGPGVGGSAGTRGPIGGGRGRGGARGPIKGFGVTGTSSRIGFSTAGVAAGASRVGGVVAGGGNIVLNGPVTVVANDPQAFINGLQKWARRGSASRSGPYGGFRLGLT